MIIEDKIVESNCYQRFLTATEGNKYHKECVRVVIRKYFCFLNCPNYTSAVSFKVFLFFLSTHFLYFKVTWQSNFSCAHSVSYLTFAYLSFPAVSGPLAFCHRSTQFSGKSALFSTLALSLCIWFCRQLYHGPFITPFPDH